MNAAGEYSVLLMSEVGHKSQARKHRSHAVRPFGRVTCVHATPSQSLDILLPLFFSALRSPLPHRQPFVPASPGRAAAVAKTRYPDVVKLQRLVVRIPVSAARIAGAGRHTWMAPQVPLCDSVMKPGTTSQAYPGRGSGHWGCPLMTFTLSILRVTM